MKVIIRADGGNNIGMGHIMRTLSIAKGLKKYFDIEYVCKMEYLDGINKVQASGFTVNLVKEGNVVKALSQIKGDILITDSYDVTDSYFEETRKMFCKTIYIDDLCIYDFKNVDMVINQNINAEDLNYNLNGGTKFLLGPSYAMLRKEFKNAYPKCIRKSISDIMITLGGGDAFRVTYKLLCYLKEKPYNFHVVIGPAFHKDYIEQLKVYEAYSNIKLYYNADMRALMEKCDICISAAGGTLYELCNLGVPSFSIITAENQHKVAEKFHSLGIIENLGWYSEISAEMVINKLYNIDKDYSKRKNISRKLQSIVDGNGSDRIVGKILAMLSL